MNSKKITYSLAFALLCGCSTPAPPPAPPLPSTTSATAVKLTVTDLKALDEANQWCSWMIALSGLAANHSNQSVYQRYGAEILSDYQKQQKAISDIVSKKSINLTSSYPVTYQKRLTLLKKRYGKSFDRYFERELAKSLPKTLNEFSKENEQKKLGSDVATILKNLIKSADIYRKQAQDLMKYE
ncbi:DUF4142 domain-containing protein [Aristophania vespae]|uniref:DUF4142 domain-containing protein n=1 Tax=Aristophania vespae TaxID=2697033 RepID=UPI00235167E9|nr:DUF4142 domain-containing protein [Aristophania vespae]UMM63472.1 hypothetical protein DM15PD_04390 [Aristophania vespae]